MTSRASVCTSPCGCGYACCVPVWAPGTRAWQTVSIHPRPRKRPHCPTRHRAAFLLGFRSFLLSPAHHPPLSCFPAFSLNLSPSLILLLPQLPLNQLPFEDFQRYSFCTL